LSDEPIRATGGGADLPESLRRVRARTPARLLVGRAGAAYRTGTQLELREAHAAARDAVWAELDIAAGFGAEFVRRWELFEVGTRAAHKDEYLLRPDLGRQFDEASRELIRERCEAGCDLQIAIGDGLSATAAAAQVPAVLPLLRSGAERRGWKVGRAFVIHHCRVGILNDIGELLRPAVSVLLIGERPGLATAESLSAYLAYRPEKSHTDANRNLVSNIHGRGLSAEQAVSQILALVEQMIRQSTSGHALRISELPHLKD
jgi:ethanolamine ammonia-lyase small subunit